MITRGFLFYHKPKVISLSGVGPGGPKMRIAGSNRSEHRKPLDVNVWERKNGWFDLRFAVDAGSCTMQLTAVYLNPLRISFWISVIDFDCARSTMLGCHHLKISKIQYWLVVYLPLWKIWKSVGIIIPNWMEKTCSKPPTSLNLVGGSVNSFKIRLKQRRRINWVSCFLNPVFAGPSTWETLGI